MNVLMAIKADRLQTGELLVALDLAESLVAAVAQLALA